MHAQNSTQPVRFVPAVRKIARPPQLAIRVHPRMNTLRVAADAERLDEQLDFDRFLAGIFTV